MCQKRISFILLLTMTFLPRLLAEDTWTSTWTTPSEPEVGQTIYFINQQNQVMPLLTGDEPGFYDPTTNPLQELALTIEVASKNNNTGYYLYSKEKDSYLYINNYNTEYQCGHAYWKNKIYIDFKEGDYWKLDNGTWQYCTDGSTYSLLEFSSGNHYFAFRKENKNNYITPRWVVKQSTTYERPVSNQWGTICLPYAIDMDHVSDVTFYGIMGKETAENVTNLILEELTTVAAGQPCFVYTPSGINTLTIPLIGDIVTTPTEDNNGLIGTFQEISQATNTLDGKYILSSNAINLCGTNCGLHAYRAYVDMDQVPELTEEQAAAASTPVRLPLASAYTTPTDNSSQNTVHGTTKPAKYIRNGHIVLSNGQQRFTIVGQPL